MAALILSVAGLSLVVPIVALPLVARADAVLTRGYQTDQPLAVGSIVSLDKASGNKVVPADTSNVDNLLGVVVNNDNAVFTLSAGSSNNQAQVASSGVAEVLVSDIGGDIHTGDQITASPISAVGMKATTNVKVIGVAQADLSQSPGKTTQTFKDKSGQTQKAQLGEIPVLVNVAYFFKQPDKTLIPNVIQNIANTVAKKSVSPLPIIISLIIFIVSLFSIISLVYSAIRSSIISVGRNPLSQAAVYRGLLQVFALAVTILGVSITIIYLILSRT